MTHEEFLILVRSGDVEAIEAALALNAGLANATATASPLLTAIYHGHADALALIERRMSAKTVFEAAASGDIAILRALIEGDPSFLNATGADGFQPLGLSCFFGHPACVRYLLDQGADVNQVSQNSFGVRPIHAAVAFGDPEVVLWLLEAGADPNARQQGGYTPLHEAAQTNRVEILRALIQAGADKQAKANDGKTPLELAIEKGCASAAGCLAS